MRDIWVMTRDAHILGVSFESSLTRECASHELFLIWIRDLYKKARLSRYWYSMRDIWIISHANVQHMSCASYECVMYFRKHAYRTPAHLPPFYNPPRTQIQAYMHQSSYILISRYFPAQSYFFLSLVLFLSRSVSLLLSLSFALSTCIYVCTLTF